MKKTLLLFLFVLSINFLFAQNTSEVSKLINEGVAYHDKGDYEGAIVRYDKALDIDKDNLQALYEKSYSLVSLEKYKDAIECCKTAIKKHPGEEMLQNVYVVYGNAYDGLKKTDKSIEVYEEGIKQFPDCAMLYFNKGISLTSVQRYDEALLCLYQSVRLNPAHAGSHNAIARVQNIQNKKIPSVLAYCRFLAIEPQGSRAKQNLQAVQKLIGSNVKKTGDKTISISLDGNSLDDTTADGKNKENSFGTIDMLLSMSSALDYDDKNKDKSDVEKFEDKMETLCAGLSEQKKDNYGFFWEYYAPYFIEMKEKGLVETYSYLAFASTDDEAVRIWLQNNQTKLKSFFEWSKGFKWNTSK